MRLEDDPLQVRETPIHPDKHPAPIWKALPWIIVCIGIAMRVAQYLHNRSLWVDECCLALNIVNKPFHELLKPLDYNQGAPIGFLLVERLAVRVFGGSEYALRLFPLLSGIAALLLLYLVARRWMEPRALLIALGLFAVSDTLIYYSSEVKQYSTDVFVALLLLWLATGQSRTVSGTRRSLLLGVVGAVAIWFSHPALFVLAGIGAAWLVPSLRKRDRAAMLALSFSVCLWLFSFASLYLLSLRHLSNNQYLQTYWQDRFMPFPSLSAEYVRWITDSFFSMFIKSASLWMPGLASLVFIVGGYALFQRNRSRLLILASPMVLALLASAVHRYPFGDRFLLFLVPTMVLLIAEGSDYIIKQTRWKSTVVGTTLLVLLFFQPVFSAVCALKWPREKEEIKPVISHILQNQRSGDVLYVYYAAWAGYEFYVGSSNKLATRVDGTGEQSNWVHYFSDLDRLKGNKRAWILFSHIVNSNGVDEEKLFLNYLDTIGTRLDSFNRPGASAYLYDLSDGRHGITSSNLVSRSIPWNYE